MSVPPKMDPNQDIQPAIELLRKSDQGQSILASIEKDGITFKYGKLPPDAGAAYDSSQRSIIIPKNAAELHPTNLAVSIAHEGFHGMQDVEHGMVPCIESEQDANFMDRVVYHELRQAGAPQLPVNHSIEANYQRFEGQAKKEDLGEFESDIKILYRNEREKEIQAAVQPAPSILRVPLRKGLEAVDADFLHDNETLSYQRQKLWNFLDRGALDKTAAAHQKQQEWEIEWLEDHQKEFQ